MTSIANDLIKHPRWVQDNIHYEVIMGSHAYGIARPDSDLDIYGWCIPPKGVLFPWLDGYIPGLDQQIPEFGQASFSNAEYDITMYSVLKYIKLVAENNPNMVDSLFVPEHCILHMSKLGLILREARHMFLSKECYHKFKGYAHSQKSKVDHLKKSKEYKELEEFEKEHVGKVTNRSYQEVFDNIYGLHPAYHRKYMQLYQAGIKHSGRFEDVKIHGYDTKFLYHTVRLLLECEQILADYDLTLDKHVELLTEVRSGVWSLEQANRYFEHKMAQLESLYQVSIIPEQPQYGLIKQTFYDIIEEHYGKVLQRAA